MLPFYSKTPRSFFRNPMRNIIVTTTVFFRLHQPSFLCQPDGCWLHADNSADTASIYTDTTNRELLWVTPPTLGRLEIAQETLAIDKPTCQSVASLYRTRRSMFVQLENYNAQIESIQVALSALIESTTTGESATNIADEITAWEDWLEFFTTKRDNTAKLIRADALASHLLSGAGYYAVVAKSGWGAALASVRSTNPGKVVNPISTSAAQLNVSVVGAMGFEPNELIANVHVQNVDSLSSVSEEFQIDIEPTKIGACFIRFPQVVVGESDPYAFGISINYEHQLASLRKSMRNITWNTCTTY